MSTIIEGVESSPKLVSMWAFKPQCQFSNYHCEQEEYNRNSKMQQFTLPGREIVHAQLINNLHTALAHLVTPEHQSDTFRFHDNYWFKLDTETPNLDQPIPLQRDVNQRCANVQNSSGLVNFISEFKA